MANNTASPTVPAQKKTWQDYLNDIFAIGKGEVAPTIGAKIDNVAEIRNALLTVVGVALGGYLVVWLIRFGISQAVSGKEKAA